MPRAHPESYAPPAAHRVILDNVAISRGEQVLVSGISFTLAPSDLIWVCGDNGIGKSSLLRLMAGFAQADAGSVHWQASGADVEARSIIAYQGHLDAFKPTFTASEALKFWAEIYENTAPLAPVLTHVGLADKSNVPCGKLSAGQKRRLSLARLLMSRKPIWLMDEPTAAMDTEGAELIQNCITDHIAAGGSAVIATHDATHRLTESARRLTLRRANALAAA